MTFEKVCLLFSHTPEIEKLFFFISISIFLVFYIYFHSKLFVLRVKEKGTIYQHILLPYYYYYYKTLSQ